MGGTRIFEVLWLEMEVDERLLELVWGKSNQATSCSGCFVHSGVSFGYCAPDGLNYVQTGKVRG